jgi:hypothetical protein
MGKESKILETNEDWSSTDIARNAQIKRVC